jgi:hypothetical protein
LNSHWSPLCLPSSRFSWPSWNLAFKKPIYAIKQVTISVHFQLEGFSGSISPS